MDGWEGHRQGLHLSDVARPHLLPSFRKTACNKQLLVVSREQTRPWLLVGLVGCVSRLTHGEDGFPPRCSRRARSFAFEVKPFFTHLD